MPKHPPPSGWPAGRGRRDEIVIDGSELLSSIRIGVKLPRAFGVRMTLATWLFNLAGWLSGTNVVVEVSDED